MKYLLFFFYLCFFNVLLWAQNNTSSLYFQLNTYSYGFGFGGSHYMGDLNPKFERIVPGVSFSAFLKKQVNSNFAIKYQASFNNFGYSDKYAKNEFRRLRNLDFQASVYELSIQGDCNFLKYYPGVFGYNFTPYLNFGLGFFYFEPYTFYEGKKYYLRKLQTEGVSYSPVSTSIPIGMGFKWGLNKYCNMGFEIISRITFTDYLDDVSTNYHSNLFDNTDNRQILQDRSYELGKAIGINNRQRGQNTSPDVFFTAQLYFSFNIYKYYCP